MARIAGAESGSHIIRNGKLETAVPRRFCLMPAYFFIQAETSPSGDSSRG
jgi:hypothetical protein